ncbi:hypothetical protein [Solicola sp. PLA-1-18]|uniref:hypothetical protein n=1 Tax=Solicola sp. PLA-1-18 TaxID=3380532 RepID=UPI003B7B2236
MPTTDPDSRSRGAAVRLDALLLQLFGTVPAVSVQTWDGSRVDHGTDGVVVHIRSRKALRRLLWAPGPLGVARAYVCGEIDVEGDFSVATRLLYDYAEEVGTERELDQAGRREVLRTTVLLGAVGPAPRPPDVALEAVGGFAPVGVEIERDLPHDLASAVLGVPLPDEERDAEEPDAPERVRLHVTSPDPLSALLAGWEKDDVEVTSVESVRDDALHTLARRAEGLAEHWAEVVGAVGEQRARVWRLSLAANAENLRRRRVAAYRVRGERVRP